MASFGLDIFHAHARVVCAGVKSCRSLKLEVLSSQFPDTFPTPMKVTQTELVLTHVDSPVQYPLYGEFCLFSVHRLFPNVSLTPCCTQSMVKAQISADHMD